MQNFFKRDCGKPVKKKTRNRVSMWLTRALFTLTQDPVTRKWQLLFGKQRNNIGFLSFEAHRAFYCLLQLLYPKKMGSTKSLSITKITSSVKKRRSFTPEQKKTIERKQKKTNKWQRRLARQKIGSTRRNRVERQIAKAHRKIADVGRDFQGNSAASIPEIQSSKSSGSLLL